MALDHYHDQDEHRDQECGHPCPVEKLCQQDNKQRDARGDGSEAIHEHVPDAPRMILHLQPMNHHACLR